MNENGLQDMDAKKKQLETLKLEQAEAEKIYRGRIQLGSLSRDPESVQVLAQTILDRKMQIEELEAQISQIEQPTKEAEVEKNKQYREETALTEYHKNPILNWIQKVINKLDEISARLDKSIADSKRRINRDPSMIKESKGLRNKWEQYQDVANADFSKAKEPHQKKSWELNPEQLEEIRRGQVEIAQKYNLKNQSVQTANRSKGLEK